MQSFLPLIIPIFSFNDSPPSVEHSCMDCHKKESEMTDPIIEITEEDLCIYCQCDFHPEYYCVPCYHERLRFLICIGCSRRFDPDDREVPPEIVLRLVHPEEKVTTCHSCMTRSDDVMFRPYTHFCMTCLITRRKDRYMCKYCYNGYKDKFAPCFHCSEIIFANPEKDKYKRT